MKDVILLITILANMILAPLWKGYVFSKLWLWFAVSIFGLVPLSIAQSIGLCLLIGFATMQLDHRPLDEENSQRRIMRIMANDILVPLFVLCIGAIYRCFLP